MFCSSSDWCNTLLELFVIIHTCHLNTTGWDLLQCSKRIPACHFSQCLQSRDPISDITWTCYSKGNYTGNIYWKKYHDVTDRCAYKCSQAHFLSHPTWRCTADLKLLTREHSEILLFSLVLSYSLRSWVCVELWVRHPAVVMQLCRFRLLQTILDQFWNVTCKHPELYLI